jgi:hypothetical protein
MSTSIGPFRTSLVLVASCLVGLISIPSGCSSSTDAAKTCAAGASVACIGPGGCAGGQACKSDGSGYEACSCGGPRADGGGDGAADGGTGNDAGNESGARDTGSSDAPYDGPACHPGSATSFQPPAYHAANRRAGACTATQIDGFYNGCVDPNAPPNGCDPYLGANATQANQKCAACILSQPTDATYGPLVARNNALPDINVAGCLEIKQGSSTCASALATFDACGAASCSANCPVVDEVSYEAYVACEAQSGAGPCQQYASAATCAAAAADAGATAVCFAGATFRDLYSNVVPVFCN